VLAESRSYDLWVLLQTEPGLDLDAELDQLETGLQNLYDKAAE
jgi:hypothetical protein